jgi:transcriptional regulator with XRE-family HTH domain
MHDDINARIATQARTLRTARGLSLEALATRSGVSRSMLSLIERGEASPTAVILDRLATGLGVPLAQLFDPPAANGAPLSPLARHEDQREWRDPASGYVRRNISPPNWPSPIRIVEVDFPPGARVAYETTAHDQPMHQQVWVLSGCIEMTVGDAHHRLDTGDCLAMQLDRPITFANRTRRPARYTVVLTPT